ncbi:MAG: hypothetical protein ACRCXD_10615, partial [Luteolibacter sp.]
MKPLLLVFLAAMAIYLPVLSQDAEDPSSTETFIPESLEIPAFTPPPPFVPKEPLPDAETTIVIRNQDGEAA